MSNAPLLGRSSDKLRLDPPEAWHRNLDKATIDGHYGVSFVLERPQPAFLMPLTSGMSHGLRHPDTAAEHRWTRSAHALRPDW